MRKLFSWLPKSRGWRIVTILTLLAGVGFLLLVVLGITAFLLFRSPKFQAWLWPRMMHLQTKANLPEPAAVPQGPAYRGFTPKADSVHSAADIYRPTNIWTVHLKFSAKQWGELGPHRVAPMANWMGPEGPVSLRNPAASRPGVAGILGFDFPWSRGDVEFGGVLFTNVGARFKGNGTFLSALRSYKRPYKLDLDKHEKKQTLGGRSALNLANLGADFSFISDAMAYEFFRDAGVPAPRTAYARVFLTLHEKFDERLLGLYALIESLDAQWAEENFGVEGVALFKPSTYELLYDLGDNWKAYERIYDPKTKLTPKQQKRLIDLAKLVSNASDSEFRSRIGEFLDLDEFARFLTCEVLLAHYDGILAQGQNFLLYLDPRSNKFGIIPWDQDHSWGEFPFISTADQRERASIWHPWARANRFLERLYAVEDFKKRYRAEMDRILNTLFVPERLNRRIDELATVVRPAVAEESTNRLAKLDIAVSDVWRSGPRDGSPFDEHRPVHQLKRFIAIRAQNVREQLAGTTEGALLSRRGQR